MLYQWEGRTVEISVSEYLSMSDNNLKYICTTENSYYSAQDPWASSALTDGGNELIEEDDDDEEPEDLSAEINWDDIGLEDN